MGIFDKISREAKVLVVDDFPTMRRIVMNALGQIGFANVVEAENGKAALNTLKKGGVQFVVSDWNMPEMMGIDLLRAVRADENLKGIPFLMVTAESQKDSMMEAMQAGVSSYIVKPFTVASMEEKLKLIFK